MKHTVIAMDIAKYVFQLHAVDAQTGEIERLKLRQGQVREFFARRAPSVVALEACGSAHYWGRELRALGHEVRLLAPKSVRPIVRSNKDDAADAQAIWTAVQQPGAHLVAIKSEAQQAILTLHRMRAQLLKFRVMQTNALRGFLYEFGIVLPQGHRALSKAWPTALAELAEKLPAMLLESLREQWARVQRLEAEIAALECRLASALRANEQCAQIAAIPGVGLLTATAAAGAIGEARTFKLGAPIRCLGRPGTTPRRHWWAAATAGAEQKRRYLSAHLVHPWRTCGHRARQAFAVDCRSAQAPSVLRSSSGAGQQARANDLGGTGPRTTLRSCSLQCRLSSNTSARIRKTSPRRASDRHMMATQVGPGREYPGREDELRVRCSDEDLVSEFHQGQQA